MRKLLPLLALLAVTCLAPPAPAQDDAPGSDAQIHAVLVALQTWTRRPPEELAPWAVAIGGVCASRQECRRLAAVAALESSFAPWVVDGSCNDPDWRASHQMHRVCDGGRAFGPWQVHDSRFAGTTPDFQASVSLQMMRGYPERWTTWARAQRLADGR